MGSILAVVALALMAMSVIGWLWIAVSAFGEGETLWGVGCLIIWPISIIYGVLNYHELKVPVLLILFGAVGRIAIGFALPG